MRRWRQRASIHRTARRHIPQNIRVYKAINGNHSWLSSTDHSYIPLSRTTTPAKKYLYKIGFLHLHFHRKLLINCRQGMYRHSSCRHHVASRWRWRQYRNVPVVVPCLCSYCTHTAVQPQSRLSDLWLYDILLYRTPPYDVAFAVLWCTIQNSHYCHGQQPRAFKTLAPHPTPPHPLLY